MTQDLGAYPVSAASAASTSPCKKMSGQSATSNGIGTARKSSRREPKKVGWMWLPSGMTSPPSTANPGEESATLCSGDSHVRIFQWRVKVKEYEKGIEVAYGMRCSMPLALFDPLTSSWRTSQLLLDGDYAPFSEDWLKRGIIVDGRLYEHRILEPHIKEKDGSVWVVCPTAMNIVEVENPDKRIRVTKNEFLRKMSLQKIEGSMNWSQWVLHKKYLPTPMLCEYFMGFPKGWTDLNASVTPWFPCKEEQPGKC